MYLGQYAAHKRVNCGVGIIISRDEDRMNVKFEDGTVVIAPPEFIVKLTSIEAGSVRLDSNNIRIVNEKIKKLRSAQREAKLSNNFRSLVFISHDIKNLKRVVSKDHNYLKDTFGINYEIEN